MIDQTLREKILTPKELNPGDILLFPPNKLPDGWVGQAIVLLTKGEVSHSAVYRGEIGGEAQVAHAGPDGILTVALKALLESEPGCYVKRHRKQTNLTPVLDAAAGYADHQNPYPFLNLGLLGLLLLTKHFSKDILRSRIFYNFALLVSLKLMKAVEKSRHEGKTPMSCSQFAAQCYTDAGNEYDIQFTDLKIKFDNGKKATLQVYESGTSSAFEKVGEQSLLSLFALDVQNQPTLRAVNYNEKELLENEGIISDDFLTFMNNDRANVKSADSVSEAEVWQVRQNLLSCFPELQANYALISNQLVVNKFPTERNYFVTPDDLLVYTSNMELMGYIQGYEAPKK